MTTRQARRKAERGGPNPLHSTFNDYVVTNRSMRRSKKTIARMLKEAVRNGQMLTYRQILDEMKP